ncbi:MAG: hypothetical protein L0216_01060 [Planctomycetales bacterium]|nr:hypothetical protein [Planctomycetales bacterium]
MAVPMGTGTGTAGEVFSGSLPSQKDKVLVVGTVTPKGEDWGLAVEDVRKDGQVILARKK